MTNSITEIKNISISKEQAKEFAYECFDTIVIKVKENLNQEKITIRNET